ncbi:unnamed protein product [Heterobilharzia americana]|nr:unnamed protein product [Heterobilharzia americana]
MSFDNDVTRNPNGDAALDSLSDQSISGRGRSHSAGSVPGPFNTTCHQESDPTHYRAAVKPCLVLRPSSSADCRPAPTNNLKLNSSASLQPTVSEVSSCVSQL